MHISTDSFNKILLFIQVNGTIVLYLIIRRKAVKTFKKEYPLSRDGINDCCGIIRSFSEENKMQSNDTVKITLGIEEALLRYLDRFGDKNKRFKLAISRAFGRIQIYIYIDGEAFNVLSKENRLPDDYPEINSIMDRFILSLSHTYSNGVNCISCEQKVYRSKSFSVWLLIAVVAGLLIGFLSLLIPASITNPFDKLLVLINDTLIGLIKMSALPVIFLCTICGICNSGGIAAFSKTAKKTVAGFFKAIFLLLIASFLIGIAVFGFKFALSPGDSHSLSTTFSLLFSVFPDNIISPFNNGDNIKVLFIAVLIGCALLTLGKRANALTRQLNLLTDISTTVMDWMCKPIPVIIGILIIQNIRDTSVFMDSIGVWQLIVIMVLIYFAAILIDCAIVSKKKELDFKYILKCIIPLFVKGTVTGSSISTYPDIEQTLTEKFKVKKDFVNFSLPLSFSFLQPGIVQLSCISLYFASLSGIALSPSWVISFLLVCFISAMAIPPVPEGIVAMLTLVFSSLSIDNSYLALATSILILTDYPSTGSRSALTALEIARLE